MQITLGRSAAHCRWRHGYLATLARLLRKYGSPPASFTPRSTGLGQFALLSASRERRFRCPRTTPQAQVQAHSVISANVDPWQGRRRIGQPGTTIRRGCLQPGRRSGRPIKGWSVAALSRTAKERNRTKAPLVTTSVTFITRSILCFSIKRGLRSPTRPTDKSYELIDFVRGRHKKMRAELTKAPRVGPFPLVTAAFSAQIPANQFSPCLLQKVGRNVLVTSMALIHLALLEG